MAQLENDFHEEKQDFSSQNCTIVDRKTTESTKKSLVDRDVDNNPDDATPIIQCGDSREETSIEDESTALAAFENWVDEWLDDFVVKYSVDFHILG